MPPIPPISGIAGLAGSGLSATTASVVKNIANLLKVLMLKTLDTTTFLLQLLGNYYFPITFIIYKYKVVVAGWEVVIIYWINLTEKFIK